MIISLILWFNYLVLAYYFAANGIYLVLLLLAAGTILSHLARLEYARYQGAMHQSVAPPVSVIVAAYNEEVNIIDSVRSLLKLNYPDFEIIVVNDGSNDRTLSRLIEGFGLKRTNVIYRQALRTAAVNGFYTGEAEPRLIVVDKAHAGKADSLNVGINVSRAPYFCSVDADSVLEEDAILRLMRPIIEAPDLVHATGGIVRLVNGSHVVDGKLVDIRLPKDSLSLIQVVEYIRSFLFGRAGLSVLNSLLVISGTFSMFQKRSVLASGGYKTSIVTEDMELVVRLHKYLRDHNRKYRITFVPDPICWTEAPKDLAMLKKQRRRWHTGLAATVSMYRSMLFNYRYGRIGLFALPYQLFIELIGPVIEVAGYFVVTASFAFGIIDRQFFMLFVIMAVLVGVFFSVAAVLLEEISYRRYPKFRDTFKLLLYSVLENFGYRQMLSLWRTQAVFKFLFSGNHKWEVVRKRGFSKPAKEA